MATVQEGVNCDSTVMAINEFIISTTEFLNTFVSAYYFDLLYLSVRCESKLNKLNNKLCQLELSLSLIETKVSSAVQEDCMCIFDRLQIDCNKGQEFLEKIQGSSEDMIQDFGEIPENVPELPVSDPVESTVLWKDHPQYAQFFKQIRVGVPVEAVKAKMRQLGLDETIVE